MTTRDDASKRSAGPAQMNQATAATKGGFAEMLKGSHQDVVDAARPASQRTPARRP